MNIGATGKSGEDRVAEYLRRQGYKVLLRNFVCKTGEIDIIAEKGEYIVFVEVKTRKADTLVSGREAVADFKRQRMLSAAKEFIAKTRSEKTARFDVAEVIITEADGKAGYSLNYIKNAF